MANNYAVIGSGLSAIAACKALIARGVRPVVFDLGIELDNEKKNIVTKLSKLNPINWEGSDQKLISSNSTINRESIPRKLAFGSDFFYGNKDNFSKNYGQVDINPPPFSFAKGGFSEGWGAAILPPDSCDIKDWPISKKNLEKYYSKVLDGIHYSAVDDNLSKNFSLIKVPDGALKLTLGNNDLLRDLQKKSHKKKDFFIFGQARLLVNAKKEHSNACRYCGICMSGCVYDSIYKASHDLNFFIRENKIEYQPKCEVISFRENGASVEIKYLEGDLIKYSTFKKIFIAAGAYNSTKIVLNSKNKSNMKVKLKTTFSLIIPMIRLKRMPLDWPKINTMPGIFLEFKNKLLSNHWIHTQISTPNELVLEKLNYSGFNINILPLFIKRFFLEHLVIAHCNLHSDHAPHYDITLKHDKSGKSTFIAKKNIMPNSKNIVDLNLKKFSTIADKMGCFILKPLVKNSNNFDSYHLGCSLPMKNKPKLETDTDVYGIPNGFKNVHVVDSSIFPSLPATTIGLVSMANAYRIASEVDL